MARVILRSGSGGGGVKPAPPRLPGPPVRRFACLLGCLSSFQFPQLPSDTSGAAVNPGDLIQSRYRLVKLLGQGASGSVWAAKNVLIDRDVALKVMSPEVAGDAVALQRFFNEAKASGRLRSPSIVEILDLGQAEDGSPFLVFELLVGEGLDEWLRRESTIAPEVLVELFLGLARALDMAHQQGIIHRDLKPANIYVHRNHLGELVGKILDFGISKVLEKEHNLAIRN